MQHEKRGQFNVFDHRWTVSYKDESGKASKKSFYQEEKAQEFAVRVRGKVQVSSWQVRGTLIRNGKKLRLKPVFNVHQKALEEAAQLRAEAEGISHATVQDLLPTALAKDAIQANLPEGWSFAGTIKFAREMGYNPILPKRTVDEAIQEYLEWLGARFDAGSTSKANLSNSTFFLKLVRLYFQGQPIQVLLDKTRVQTFCEGRDPIPCYETINKDRSMGRKNATESDRQKGWSLDTQRGVASAISAMMNQFVRGRYVDKYTIKGMFWFPKDKEIDPYVMDFDEIRNLLDKAWVIAGGRHAARYIIALFGAVRPYEIDSWDKKKNNGSYLDLTNGVFYVHIKRKTGCRAVNLPPNARTMLQILKKEGRLDADEITPNCYRIRQTHKGTLTYFHARLGYRVGAKTVERKSISAERFWELNPVIYEAGWIQDALRHTCLDFYYYATNNDAGSTAGYAGHLRTQFYKNYKGKLRTDNIPAAVAQFYRLMPHSLRHLETGKDPQGAFAVDLPSWFKIKNETELARKIEHLASVNANLALVSYDARAGRTTKPLNHFELVEHSWRVHFTDRNGEARSTVVFKKAEVAELARKHGLVAAQQPITFPIEKANIQYLNGCKIQVNSWRVEGRVLLDGKRVWLRPVRTCKQDAQELLRKFTDEYTLDTSGNPEQN